MPRRFLFIQALPLIEEIENALKKSELITQFRVAGSFRRGKETIGDLDILVVSKHNKKVMDLFTTLSSVQKILAKGETKSSVLFESGLQVDLRVVKKEEFGAALLYFTGSKEHNVALRKIALKKKYTLNEYALSTLGAKKIVAQRSEKEIYQKLGLSYVEPELRENWGEIELARKGTLPKLVEVKDIKGVFHNHSKWSDGSNTLLEMAQRAQELKFKFISFNDHFGPVGIANPLNEKRLTGYLKEIEKVRKKVGIRVFSGVEADILKNGELALSKKLCKKLDVVVGSVHLALKMERAQMTKRICHALENYPITILGHPTARLLQKREPIDFDHEKVFSAAHENKTFLEINAAPKRMDLSGELVRLAHTHKCQFALSTDAHHTDHLSYAFCGVNMARRGGLEKKSILNTWRLQRIERALQK